MLILGIRKPKMYSLEPGEYQGSLGPPPDGYDPDGGTWFYFTGEGGLRIGAAVKSLHSVEIVG